jgi:hypothetical protein
MNGVSNAGGAGGALWPWAHACLLRAKTGSVKRQKMTIKIGTKLMNGHLSLKKPKKKRISSATGGEP